MSSSRLYYFQQLHRSLLWISLVGGLLFSFSGLIYPLINRLALLPPLPPITLPAVPENSDALKRALHSQGIHTVLALQGVSRRGQWWWRVEAMLGKPARWINAQTGQEEEHGDWQVARDVAERALGHPLVGALKARWITQFEADYLENNRLLPVWRIDTAEGLTFFVDTQHQQVVTTHTPLKIKLSKFFRVIHTGEGLSDHVRRLIGMGFLLSILGSVWTGLVLARTKASSRHPTARWHRYLGWVASITLTSFAISGALQLTMRPNSLDVQPQGLTVHHGINVDTIPEWPVGSNALFQPITGWWLAAWKEHPAWLRSTLLAQTSLLEQHSGHKGPITLVLSPPPVEILDGMEWHDAEMQLLPSSMMSKIEFTNQTLRRSTWITHFDGEYSATYKRLPVLRINNIDGSNRYIDPLTGHQVAYIAPIPAFARWFFRTFHEWSILDTNKNARDALLISASVLQITVMILGGRLFWQRRRITGTQSIQRNLNSVSVSAIK